MNISHFVENLNRGGLERMVIELAKVQHARGHRVRVICLYEPGTLAQELETLGIAVLACDKQPSLDLRALRRARRWIRSHNTEVLHTHNAVAHYHAVIASIGLGARIINTRHGMGGNQRGSRREWLFRRSLLLTDIVVSVCEAARTGAVKQGMLPAKKARVVPNGIRVESFRMASGEMRERLHQLLDLPARVQVIGTVGRLNWAKDQASLIRAFRLLHEREPDTALLLVGDGELRNELQQCAMDEQVAGSVHFLGDRNDVPELLGGLDVFALSSVSEGYSMALLEASAVALPIIATDVGGNSEIVKDGLTGTIVPARNVTALSDAMFAMLQQAELTASLAHGARAWVEQHGSVEAMAARYDELYRG
ncbi:glycosyltransferase [Rhodanobacter sp. L36]|uniref:glycosyltransferase n=1 Tax=Rhodanobacter sp. L36 TaxID=1747221 RepID=UPI00131CA242|nr:glycosyltransferase [Rhodanobacter sp. L36]